MATGAKGTKGTKSVKDVKYKSLTNLLASEKKAKAGGSKRKAKSRVEAAFKQQSERQKEKIKKYNADVAKKAGTRIAGKKRAKDSQVGREAKVGLHESRRSNNPHTRGVADSMLTKGQDNKKTASKQRLGQVKNNKRADRQFKKVPGHSSRIRTERRKGGEITTTMRRQKSVIYPKTPDKSNKKGRTVSTYTTPATGKTYVVKRNWRSRRALIKGLILGKAKFYGKSGGVIKSAQGTSKSALKRLSKAVQTSRAKVMKGRPNKRRK